MTTELPTAATTVSTSRLRFVLHVIQGQWISLFASFTIMSVGGGTYIFGVYSKEIKSSLGYDQSTLNLLGFFKDLGSSVGIFSGLIAEVTPTWSLLVIGSSLNFVGYFVIWLAVTGKIAKPQVWHMCTYICIAANSLNFANTAVLVTCVKNFPENRGVMLGLLKGFAGLSGAIMTQLYLALYGNDPQSLILLIAWLPPVIFLTFVYMIRPMKVVRHSNEVRVLYQFLYVSIVLALFLMVMTITQKLVAFPPAAYAASATLVCGLVLFPISIVFRQESLTWKQKPNPLNPTSLAIEIPKQSTIKQEQMPKTSCFSEICNKPLRGEDYTILQAIFSIDMLILLISAACGIGSNLTAIDNLGQIGESLGYPTKTINTFVSLVSIWNYSGRIFAGLVSEKLVVTFKFPRPLMITCFLLMSCVGHLLIAFPVPGSVYVASVIIGFSFGAQFPLINVIISELFGLKHFATLFNVGQLASPLGSYILNVRVTGLLYDHEANKDLLRNNLHRSSTGELTCIGAHCYRMSFIILASVTCFGALASLILVARTREFYKGDIYKKFREEVAVAESN